jgi:hypothetical protein
MVECRRQCSYPLLDFSDQIVEVVGRYTLVAVAGFRVRAATVADDSIAGIALQPISWCSLNDRDEKRAILKLTIGNSQISFKYCFFTDWAYFRHFISFLKDAGESHELSR